MEQEKKHFDVVVSEGSPSSVMVPDDLRAKIEDSDFSGYSRANTRLPSVTIRQSEGDGNPAGGFQMFSASAKRTGKQIIDAEPPLKITIIYESHRNQLWKGEDIQCVSWDGKHGRGEPGGLCLQCPKSKWIDDTRPECTLWTCLACYDHDNGSFYSFDIKGSSMRAYRSLLEDLEGQKLPHHAAIVEVNLKKEKNGNVIYYVPVFTIVGAVSTDMFLKFKAQRDEIAKVANIEPVQEEEIPHGEMPI